jgi:hypothetical protein
MNRKHWQDRLNPSIPKTHRHKRKNTQKRGFTKHVHQRLNGPLRIEGIKPERGEWYLCGCGVLLLQVTLCEIPLSKIEEIKKRSVNGDEGKDEPAKIQDKVRSDS